MEPQGLGDDLRLGAGHEAGVALHFMHYNFCHVHQTLRVTPAMEAGPSDHVWSLEELCGCSMRPTKKPRR